MSDGRSMMDAPRFTFDVPCHPNSRIQRMLDVFTGPMTQLELAAAAGTTQTCVCRYLQRLLNMRARQVHISGWKHADGAGRQRVAIYSPGPGADAKCTLQFQDSDAVRSRNYRERQRVSGDWEDKMKANRARYWKNKPVQRDPMTSALFGPAA